MKIRELRLSKNMTQKEFADMLNIGRTTVAMWESGAASPHTSKVPQIADALGCSIEDLFEDSTQKNVIYKGKILKMDFPYDISMMVAKAIDCISRKCPRRNQELGVADKEAIEILLNLSGLCSLYAARLAIASKKSAKKDNK